MKIPAALGAAAAALILALGCGGGPKMIESNGREAPVPRLPPPSPVDSVFVLESTAIEPEDTVVKVPAATGRVILVRRGAPDNSLFARIEFPATDSTGKSADSLEVTITPRPGRYGIDIEYAADSAARPRLTFSYALSFVAPAGARARYGSDLEFEKVLLIARLDGGRVTFLPTTSPGADLVTTIIPGPGRYIVAAPRS